MIRPALLIAAAFLPAAALAAPQLSAAWSDHAVIQRDAPIVFEGRAAPGETVTGTLGGESATALADAAGRFTLRFAPRAASPAPLALTLNGAPALADLLVGDVWLCSGQSNMEMQTERSLNSWGEVMQSADPGLRLFHIPKQTALTPADSFEQPVAWTPATPATVAPFSAACYHMAKTLRRDLKVPIGAIHASWGGSQIRPWLDPESGRKIYGAAEMDLLAMSARDPLGAVGIFAAAWQAWYFLKTGGSAPWLKPQSLTWQPVPAIGYWNKWTGTPLAANPQGTVWMRRTVALTPAQARSGAVLSLGVIDDVDMTWVNGKAVGNTFSWDKERNYPVPASFLKPGKNEILVAISNSWSTGGWTTGADRLALTVNAGQRIALGDGWSYSAAPVSDHPPRSPWDGIAGIGVMHNRMVAPLGHIALKGAAWYQGESDVGIPGYQGRLAELFAGWRRQFSPGMRMLVVQLAGFGPAQTAPVASGWGALRDEQRRAVEADANAALITAIDLGERTDIHPANKVELGRRLGLAARGIALPRPLAARREGGDVRVSFAGIEGGLAAWSGDHALAFELCGADQSTCRYAIARVDGDSVVLSGDGRPATRVRYAWADTPVVNLNDARPLPVPGFELPVE